MTIPEAVQLIIRAGSLSEGSGQVFVLEMGEPIKIVDLAETMIRLSGLEPDRDIAIEIVGARPGEKFHEDLFNPYERSAADACAENPARRATSRSIRSGSRRRSRRSTCSSSRATRRSSPSTSRRLAGRSRGVRRPSRPDRNVDCERCYGIAFPSPSPSTTSSTRWAADAGFAAIIGLAILILLYFAQARETASLREHDYEWAQRVQQLEARVNQLSRQQASLPAPAPQPQGRTMAGDPRAVPAAAGAVASRPAGPASGPGTVAEPALAGAPAGVAAPALTAATKLIPTYVPPVQDPVERLPVGAGELPPDATAVVAPPPQPATVAGGANGSSLYDHAPVEPPPAGRTPPPAPPRIQIRQGAPAPGRRGTIPPRTQPQRTQRSRGRRGLALALIALLAAAVVIAVVVLSTGGSSKPKQASSSTSARNASAPRHRVKTTTPVKPASVTVAVLNGTATSGLAGRVSQKLTTDGYKPGTVATAADQTRTSTAIAYMPGHAREALAVARSLNRPSANVQAVDQSTQAVACPPPAACTAQVIVTVGTDLATTH